MGKRKCSQGKKIELQEKLKKMSKEKENQQDSEEEHVQEKEIFMDLYKQIRLDEEEIKQKSRCLWLKVGDTNTTFFHNNLKIRRPGNQSKKFKWKDMK